MSFLSRISIANRSLVALVTLAIIIFGLIAAPSLKQELFPSIEFPAISIVAPYPGASPSVVEQDVTNPLEQSIQGLPDIQQTSSYSNQGSAVIVVDYNYGVDLNQESQRLSQQINRIQSQLPSGVTPQVNTFNISDQPIIQMAVTSSQDEATLATNLNSQVVPALQGINGVASVNVTGVRSQIVAVTLDINKMKTEGLSVSQVQGALQANNTTIPAGELTNNGQTFSVNVSNTYNSLADLENVIVGEHIKQTASTCLQTGASSLGGSTGTGSFGGRTGSQASTCTPTSASAASASASATPVKLSAVATVQQILSPSTTLTRTNGKDSLGISVTKTSSGNTVTISNAIRSQITALQNKLGNGTTITIVSDQAPTVSDSVNGLVREGLIGAAFAILVILAFLLSVSSTLVTAISIPLSILIALIGLWIGNYTLNIFTLGALTVAIGRVVDDSIVVLENIYRHLSNGEKKPDAILNATREVAGAVTSSTVTTVAVFIPIAFLGGIIGQVFSPFAVTVVIALLASLFVALTIVPVLAYWFLKPPKNAGSVEMQARHDRGSFLERGYVPILRWVTSHKAITLILAVLLFAGSLTLIPSLGTNFFNPQQQNSFSITQTMPVGSSLDTTNQAAKQIETILQNTQHIQFYQMTVGSKGGFSALLGGASGYNTANFTVTTDTSDNEATVQQQVQNKVKALTNAGSIQVAASQGGGFNSSSIVVNVQASDQTVLRQATQQVLDAVSNTPNTTNVSSNLADASPLINISVDPQKAAAHGLTAAQVGQLLREVYTGTTITTVTFNNTQENVVLQVGTPATTVNDINNLLIPTATGSTVKLSDVATVLQGKGPTQIIHNNGTQTATVNLTATSQNTGAISAAIQKKLNSLSLPSGATASLSGTTSQQAQAFSGLGIALLTAILLVYLVMVATFRSIVQPLILLVSIPFAATGSVLLLLATHNPLGVPALIGLLMLVGIVVTNAIVLLDLVHQYRAKGMDARTAVIEGGRRRLRPILMTAIATILALIPMASGLSQASGFIGAPLAITVIGGLTTSTLLTLLLVPTLYVMIEGRGKKNDVSRQTPVAPTREPELQTQGQV